MTQRLISEPAFIERVLAEAEVGHLAIVDGDVPYVVPLSFVALAGRVYFHSSLDGRKMELIRRRPRVAFSAHVIDCKVTGDKACSFGVHYRSVQASGVAREVTDGAVKVRALNALAAKEADGLPFAPVAVGETRNVAVVEIELVEATGKENV